MNDHRLNRVDMAVFDFALKELGRAFGPLEEDGQAVGILIDVESELALLFEAWELVKKEQGV